MRARALGIIAAVGVALGASWIHGWLWPLGVQGESTAFAALVGIALYALFELSRVASAASHRRTLLHISAYNERLVRTFFEHTPTAVAMLDRDLRYIVHSRAWTRQYNLGDGSLVGRRHYDVFPDIPDRWKEVHQRCLAGAVEQCSDDQFIRPDGQSHFLRWDCRPWYEADGSIGGLTFMTEDITESKRVEYERTQHNQDLLSAARTLSRQAEALGRASEEAQAANRAKSEFLANISHEIRTPLTAILGYTDVLKDPALSPTQRSDALDRLASAGTHLSSLLNDVLDLTKIEAGRMTVESVPTDLARVVRDAVDMFALGVAEKGLRLEIIVGEGVPARTLSDPTRLRQIVSNLVSNAVKFTSAGSIVVRVSAPDASRIVIDVRDTGIGIDESQLPRLFKPFSQADGSTTRRFGGTGLGLRISRRLAQLMGGDLTVTSRHTEGSTFSLTIPSVSAAAGAPAPAIEPRTPIPAPGSLCGRTVLVIDDSPDNLVLAATHLRRAGASVTCDQGGAAALGRMSASTPLQAFDLVLLDLQMPELDGYEVLGLLRSHGVAAPIVAFTAHASCTERGRALDAGFDGFFSKPFTPEAIINACSCALAAPGKRAA